MSYSRQDYLLYIAKYWLEGFGFQGWSRRQKRLNLSRLRVGEYGKLLYRLVVSTNPVDHCVTTLPELLTSHVVVREL